MLRGMSSLSLLAVPCPKLGLLLFCFFTAEGPSAGCLSRLSRTSFAFFEGLLLVVVVAAVVVAVVVVTVAVFRLVVVTVAVFKLVVVTVAVELTATVTGFESLLVDFRFLDRETSDVDVVGTFTAGFSI
jgi:hypothetical protein